MRTARIAIWLPPIIAAMLWALPGVADAQQSRSLDEELLDQLSTDPLDDVDRELFGGDKKQGRGGQSPGTEDEALAERLRRELGDAADPEDENPLLTVARKMCNAQQRIAGKDSGPATSELQKQIVADLDALIQQMRKRCRQGKPAGDCNQTASRSDAGQPQPKQGAGQGTGNTGQARDSNAKPGKGAGRQPDMQEMEQVIRELWGILPQHNREQVTQPPTLEFLPKYESLIEEYFRRLAEERSGE